MLYREFATQEQIDAEYNVGARRAGFAELPARLRALSDAVRAEADCELGLAFGPTRDEHLDVYRAGGVDRPPPGRPVLVFVHGGYWRAFGAADWGCVARGPLAHGIDVVVTNYSLAPKVTIDEITRQSRAAVAWVHAKCAGWGGDPGRVYVCGHSAGGQQAAMLLDTDWEGEYGLPAGTVRGGVAISGVYDLRPLPYSYLSAVLQLTRRTIETQSPLLRPPRPGSPRVVAWGGGETAEFVRQSREYAAHCRAAEIDVHELSLGSDDHFDAVLQLHDPASPLTRSLAERLLGE